MQQDQFCEMLDRLKTAVTDRQQKSEIIKAIIEALKSKEQISLVLGVTEET